MNTFNELDFQDALSCLAAPEPPASLVARTKSLMHAELRAETGFATARNDAEVFILLGVTVALSFCLFYMFTVGTVLRLFIPPEFLNVLKHSLYGLTALGGSMLTLTLSVICIRRVWFDSGRKAVTVRV